MRFRDQLHTDVEDFDVRDNELVLDGRTLSELAADVGRTPFYAYSSGLIRKRIDYLQSYLPDGVELHYAIKANPMAAVVGTIQPLVNGLDVASKGELEIAVATGCNSADISFAGPGKTNDELAAAIQSGVTINVESPGELARIDTIARTANKIANIAIRVNPSFELKSSGMKMGGGPKQFGIDEEQVPELLGTLEDLSVRFVGFHIFSGSQNLRPESICQSQVKALHLALELAKYAPNPPNWINIGGGFGIPYFKGDQPLQIESISKNLYSLVRQLRGQLEKCKLILELGRYLVAEAGVYVCEIVDIKISRGHKFLITNGGLHHHLAASGNFGQVIRKNYPVIIGTKVYSDELEQCSVVGPLCTPLDLLGDKMNLAKAETGDLVVVFQSGAYGYTASPQLFLGHPAPAEILI